MRVLVACEESQAVCIAFRNHGHEAYSCDIQECSGGHPEWHIQGDCLPLLDGDCDFVTCDGTKHHTHGQWDLLIAHPPCTFLSGAGNGWLSVERYGDRAIERSQLRDEAAEFFMMFVKAKCKHKAIENPVGYMNSTYRHADQIIHPYYFAKDENDLDNYHMKQTCLWLFQLPKLERISMLEKPAPIYVDYTGKKRYYVDSFTGIDKDAKKMRSKTFPGVASAMAEQWGNCLEYYEEEYEQTTFF